MRSKKFIGILLLFAVLFSLTSCSKSIKYIKPDEMTGALEKTFDIKESDDYSRNAYTVSGSRDGSLCSINASVSDDNGYIKITYRQLKTPEETADYFDGLYDQSLKSSGIDPAEHQHIGGHKSNGSGGYFVCDQDGFFLGQYCTDNLYISINAHSDEQRAAAKDFAKDLGLPIE